MHDDQRPAPPVITGSTPTSPSHTSTNPTLSGSAESGTTVRLFTSPDCASAVAGTDLADPSGFGAAVQAAPNGSRTFYANATDAAGNASDCSAGFTYIHDDQKPAAPTWVGTTPPSPSRTSTSPTLSGHAETDAQVAIYAGPGCTGSALVSVTAAANDFGAAVTAAANQTSRYSATATDKAGNTSDCSLPIAYIHDSTPPDAPVLTGTTPPSPTNTNLNPVVNGSAEAGSTVRLYLNGSCSDPSVGAPATAAADQSFAIAATVTANSSTTFFAKAIDAAGNASACSNGVTYVHDNTGSGTPIIVRSIPASPNKTSTTPTLEGTAEAGSTVRLYKLPDCSGAVAGSGPATGGNFSIATSVTANTTTTFFAQATDTALNVSACSAGFAYTHDAQKPAKPTLTGTTPDSPAKSTTPTVNGSAEAGSTVRLYTNAGCTTANGAPATAAADLSFGISASVAATASTTFYATATDAAGNVSDCSDPLVYVSDNTAPAAPTWTGTTPTSPSSTSTTPTLAGSSEASATVRIYASTNCSGAAVATVGPLAAATFTQQVTAGANTTTSWTATATDAAGNVSPCSAAIAFTHDATAPPTPILTGTTPTSPSKTSTTPSVNGTTAETGVSIDLFANGTCAGSATKTLANATASFSIATTVTANSATTFSAKARDAAGNASGCSNAISYTHDATAPAAPAITSSSPTSPSRTSTTPTLGGTAEALATVDIFTTSNCTGTVAGTGTATASGFSGIAVNANANATTTFFARATDLAGNPSPCSAGFDYVHDNQGPTKPVLTGTNPTSPSNSGAEPQVLGTITEAGLTLQLYKSTDCTGAVAATKTNAPTSFAITVSVGSNTTTPFSATATDLSGNTSACSNSISYTHDDKTPLKPVITGTNPTSPSNASTTPQVLGTTAEAGLTVRLHLAASCLDAVLASGPSTPSGGAGAFAISAPATANQTTVFYADATDAAGNLSTCSAGFAYVHDNTAPGVPVLTAFSPASPSTTNSGTTVTGSESDPTSKVFVYPSADCSGAAANPSGTTAVAGTFTIAFTAASLGCTPVSAKAVDAAGNASACSASLTFAHYGCGQCGCPASDWLRELGTTAADSASAIAMDYNSNLYVVGTTYGGLLGQLPLGSADGVLVKRASNGNPVWARQLGTAAYDSATAVTVDPLGNVYVAGSTEGDINGSGSAPPACATNLGAGTCGDAWIAKYDGTGSRLWVNRYSSARRESTTELEWDAKGTRVLMLVSSANDAGSGVSPQLFAVAPATGTMTQLWASIDDTQSKAPSGLAVDSSGNAYVQGRAPSPISGALSTTGSGGNGLVYIYKLTSTGGFTWLQHWGSPGLDAGTDLTVDGSGNVYAAGFLQGAPDGTGAVGGPYRGDSGAVPAVGGDAAVARFDSTGAQQWARIYGTPTDDLVASIWLYNARLYLAGQTKGDLGAGTATSLRGGVDIFVATLNLDGTAPASNTRQYGSAGDDLIGRSILDSGTWYIPGTSSADWVGMSKDMCNYLGLNDVFVGRFCSP
ncbi:MAG: Ig-like domain-containing protein [Myxococcota bacterium]